MYAFLGIVLFFAWAGFMIATRVKAQKTYDYYGEKVITFSVKDRLIHGLMAAVPAGVAGAAAAAIFMVFLPNETVTVSTPLVPSLTTEDGDGIYLYAGDYDYTYWYEGSKGIADGTVDRNDSYVKFDAENPRIEWEATVSTNWNLADVDMAEYQYEYTFYLPSDNSISN